MKKIMLPLGVLFASCAFAQQEKSMSEIQAQMIYNFLKYIQWPNETEGGDFVVGVLGEDEVFKALKSYYDGKPRGAKKFVVKKLASAEEAGTCSVVYLGKTKSRDFEDIKNGIAGKSVLTITDSFNLGSKGSCINFKVIDGKLKFEMNQASLLAAALKVSTQLSSLAILI